MDKLFLLVVYKPFKNDFSNSVWNSILFTVENEYVLTWDAAFVEVCVWSRETDLFCWLGFSAVLVFMYTSYFICMSLVYINSNWPRYSLFCRTHQMSLVTYISAIWTKNNTTHIWWVHCVAIGYIPLVITLNGHYTDIEAVTISATVTATSVKMITDVRSTLFLVSVWTALSIS